MWRIPFGWRTGSTPWPVASGNASTAYARDLNRHARGRTGANFMPATRHPGAPTPASDAMGAASGVRANGWRLHLFGTPRLVGDGGQVDLPSQLPSALLLVLALNGDWVTREWLSTLVWPDAAAPAAQHNLRVNLHRLRALLQPLGLDARVQQQRRRLRLDLASDLGAFRSAVERRDPATALRWHTGPALQNLVLPAFPALEDWLHQQRLRLEERVRQCVIEQALTLQQQGQLAQALELLTAHIDRDPQAEEAMQLLLRLGRHGVDPGRALEVFQRFRRRLRHELAAEPMPMTLALADGLGAASGHDGDTPEDAPWVGRAAEQQALRAPKRRCVLLLGEAGSGKTRLLRRAVPPPVLRLQCRHSERGLPLACLLRWMAEQADRVRAWPGYAAHRRQLAPLVPALADAETLAPPPLGSGKRLVGLLARLLHEQEDTLVVDDLQWADEATLAVLRTLTVQLRSGWIAAARPEELHSELRDWLDGLQEEGTLERVELAPWSMDELRQLLLGLGWQDGSGDLPQWLLRRAGGHPMLTLETLSDLWRQRGMDARNAPWRLAPPRDETAIGTTPAVQRLVQRRVARLGQAAPRLLALAALAGDAHDIEALAQILGLTPVAAAEALGAAQQAGLLRGRLFAHDLVRESLCAALPEAQRTQWHAALAQNAPAAWPAARRAAHWQAAGRWPECAAATEQAAADERLRGLLDPAAARLERLLTQAAALSPPWPARLALERARCAWEGGDRTDTLHWCGRVLACGPDGQTHAALQLLQTQLAKKDGRIAAAQALAQSALQSAEPGTAVATEALQLVAALAHQQGDFMQAEQRYVELVRHLRRLPPGPDLALALSNLAAAITAQGRPLESLPLHAEACSLAERLQARHLQVQVATNRLGPLMQLGRFDEAIAIGRAALALGSFEGTPQLLNNMAGTLQAAGRWAEATDCALRLVDDDDATLRCVSLARLLKLQAQTGGEDRVPNLPQRVLQAMQQTDHYMAQAMGIVALLDHGPPAMHADALRFLRHKGLPQRMQELLSACLQRHAGQARHGMAQDDTRPRPYLTQP